MKCLSVQQPWALAIFRGKDVENRSWRTKHRGPMLIQAGKRWAAGAQHTINGISGQILVPKHPQGAAYTYMAIIGVVNLVDIVENSTSPWAMSGYKHWVLEDRVLFPLPIPWPGQQQVFNVPDEILPAAFRTATA